MLSLSNRATVTHIIEVLKANGFNDNGIIGILANTYAESGCRTNNLQNKYESEFGLSDEEFTKAVDNGSFNFCNPNIKFGYGLCQWTSYGRRCGLYNYCKSKGVSIADETAQIEWMISEFKTSYKMVYAELTSSSNTIESCTEIVLCKYEVPKSVLTEGQDKQNTIAKRIGYAKEFKEEFFGEVKVEKKILALSCGHYKYTSGKRCDKTLDPSETREWVLNARIGEMLTSMLSEYEGIEIVRLDDPSGETLVSLDDRALKSNNAKADFYLAIHHNAGVNRSTGGGIVVYHYPGRDAIGKSFYNHVLAKNGLKGNRSTPVKSTTALVEVYKPKAISILLENGFMDSKTDTPIILTEAFAKNTALGICEFFVEYWGLKKKEEKAETANRVKLSEPAKIFKESGEASPGIYTITEVSNGMGKLKSGAGWISLANTISV